MNNGGTSLANRDLQTALAVGSLGGLSDGQLLDLYLTQRDEAVFEAIVRRHGPMVWGVCWRVLRDHHDAEDAFQAAFLVLARKSASINPRDKLGHWLHGVAYQTALNLRGSRTRRRLREVPISAGSDAESASVQDANDRLARLDREVNRLPDKFRIPIVLCELEGLTHREAAERLGWPIGTVSGRLSRARAMLAGRLSRRDGPLSDGSLGLLLAQGAATACLPAHLIGPTTRAATLMITGRATLAGVVSADVASLMQGVTKTMLLARIKSFAVVGLLGFLASGAAVVTYRTAVARGERPLPAQTGSAFKIKSGTPAAAPASPTPPALSGRLDLRVLGPDGTPAAGAPVQYIVWIGGRGDDWDFKTDVDGRLTLSYDPKAAIESLLFIIRQPGTVPVYVLYDGKTPPLLVPPSKEVRLERGQVIGGVVRNEDGAPVADALVTVTIPATEAPDGSTTLDTRRATDDEGRWSFDGAPNDLARVRIKVEAEGYPEATGVASLARERTLTTLTRGRMIAGTVLDPDGQPIRRAHVLLGDRARGINPRCPVGYTDVQGRFRLGGESPAATVITVQAKGFAPALREFAADGPSLTLDPIRLEPGRTLRLRVVDSQGNPIPKVGLWPGRWRGHETLRLDHGLVPVTTTDADGRFAWPDLPSDPITLDIREDGFMSQTGVSLVANDIETTVILRPEIVVAGRVTDARTGAPIPRFLVVEGTRGVSDTTPSWAVGHGHEGHDGQLRERSGVGYAAWFLRVEAPGYRPAESRGFDPDSGNVTWDVALEPARSFTAVVVDPAGKPVPGLTVGLVPRGGNVVLEEGRLSQYSQFPHFPIRKTDAEGRFEFNVPEGDHALATADPAGFAAVPVARVEQSGRLVLTPWGSIAGEVRVGTTPGANEAIGVEFVPPDDPATRLPVAFVAHERRRADVQGRFRIDHAIPGAAVVRRLIVQEFDGGRGSMSVAGWRTPTVVRSGTTSVITVGGRGRSVVGEVVANPQLPGPIDLSETIAIAVTPGPLDVAEVYSRSVAAALVSRDGRFRIDDLPPGRYTLYGYVGLPKVGDQFRSAHLGHNFEVPPGGPADPPLDLGRVVPQPDEP